MISNKGFIMEAWIIYGSGTLATFHIIELMGFTIVKKDIILML